MRFRDCPQGSKSDSAPSITSEVAGDEEGVDKAADLRRRASNYLQYIESLSQAYESQLNALSAFFKTSEMDLTGSLEGQFGCYRDDPAVTIVEICKDGTQHLIGIDDVDLLVDYFCEQESQAEERDDRTGGRLPRDNVGVPSLSRVFLMDRITPDIMGVFGAEFGVEPQFWDAHLQMKTAHDTMGGMSAVSSGGQLVRYGSESGSKVAFLNIPLLRRHPPSESLDKKEGGKCLPVGQQEGCEGCSIHLGYCSNDTEPTTVLVMTSSGNRFNDTYTSKGSLRASFIEQIMSTGTLSNPIPLTHRLIKAILHHFCSTLATIPQQTQQQISQFRINLFKDDAYKIRESISSEATVISTLSKTLSNCLLAVDNLCSSTVEGGSGVRVLDALAPLLQQFHEQAEQVTQWLKDFDTTIIDNQRQREARLRRLKIVIPICSVSLAVVVVVVVTGLVVSDGV
ncbi:hypothetical protein TWF718_010057 [Orbilia javanica]|uniref:Uncharacterized protein n=1 Tax=Orbilia javanica TaxID=47235 RepID=A0AAN8MRN1_9PEZI